MTTTRWWIAGAVLAMAVIVALGWVLGIDPRLAEASAADDDRAGVEALNATYEQELVRLKKLDEDLPALTKELDVLRAALPSDAQVSTLLGQLNALAADSLVELTAVTAGVPTTFASLLPVAEDAPAASDDAEGAEDVTSAAAVEPAVVAVPENFVAVPIKATVQGDPTGVLDFVKKVQYGTRLFLVRGLEISYDGGGGEVTIEGFVYVLTQDATTAVVEPAEGD